MERKIYAIGDSHSLRCFEKHPVIADSTIWHGYNKLDGKTAYKLRDHERILRKTILPLREKSLIFCFGEVDVRIHIQRKHEQTGTPTHLLLQRTATRYLELVKELRLEGFDIHVFNVIPTGDFHGAKFEAWQRGLHYPFTTTFEERDHYTLSLNDLYRSNCRRLKIPFIDIYAHLVDENGRRKSELIYDFSHLNAKTADILLENYSFG